MAVMFAYESGSIITNYYHAVLGLIGLILAWCLVTCTYYAYFHPLSSFPGPKLWSASFLFRHAANMRGQLDWHLMALHEQYGPVVRFSPEELSFISDQAWKDIYNNRTAHLVKDPAFYNLSGHEALSIFNASENAHPRMRKQLSHAFSARALRDQEPLLKKYVDRLISELGTAAHSDEPVDMDDWYNYTTFDMVGKLTIGKSFHTLQSGSHRQWIKDIWSTIKLAPFLRGVATYMNTRQFIRLVEMCLPRSFLEGKDEYGEFMVAATERRMSLPPSPIEEDRGDFLSYMLKHQHKDGGLTDDEIEANCGFLIVAGSETTATALSGMTWYLLRNPEKLKRLTTEIRGAFTSEEEMTSTNLAARLPYTLAVIHEGLRLYPSAPTIAPRRTPVGRKTMIDGHEVPGWTSVGVHALTASRSATNFHEPLSFVPERWLPNVTSDPSSPYHNDHRGASQPFSIGPRACLGKSLAYDELRLILARLFWKYDLELCEESEEWGDHQLTFGLWAKPALMCKLRDIRGGEKS